MNKLLLTDTHFGWKNNSITWLKSQLELLDKQIIPYLQSHPNTRVIHLGDVFESRSSISPMHAKEVRKRFVRMAELADEVYLIGGNHDFYSPANADYESLSLVFRDCKNINLVIDEIVIKDEDAMIPWYQYKMLDINKFCEDYPEVRHIYTHADIFGEDKKCAPPHITLLSGHIHTPRMEVKKVFGYDAVNLGSCYPLDFNDANQNRFFYTVENNVIHAHENEHCIKFHRIYGNIFDQDYKSDDYYEIYLNSEEMQDQRHKDYIKKISEKCHNMQVIPIIQSMEADETYVGQNIETICKDLIPDKLKEKFNKVLEVSNKTE